MTNSVPLPGSALADRYFMIVGAYLVKEELMRPLKAVLLLTVSFALGVQPAEAQETVLGAWKIVETWGHNPQQGEWRTENVQPSVFLFMEGYYSITHVGGNESRPLMPEGATREDLTVEQAAAVWLLYTSNSGTLEVTPSTITTRPMVALWPNFMEGESRVYTYRIEGGTLELSSAGDDWSWNARLQRLR